MTRILAVVLIACSFAACNATLANNGAGRIGPPAPTGVAQLQSDPVLFERAVAGMPENEETRSIKQALRPLKAQTELNSLKKEQIRAMIAKFTPKQNQYFTNSLLDDVEKRKAFCNGKEPRIHVIGRRSILLYENKLPRNGIPRRFQSERSIHIPYEGRDLFPECVIVYVAIIGDVPPLEYADEAKDEQFDVVKPTYLRPDLGEILLK
jgi:hypothetical protein